MFWNRKKEMSEPGKLLLKSLKADPLSWTKDGDSLKHSSKLLSIWRDLDVRFWLSSDQTWVPVLLSKYDKKRLREVVKGLLGAKGVLQTASATAQLVELLDK